VLECVPVDQALQLRIYDKQQLVCTVEPDGPVELGRQSEAEAAPYHQRRDAGWCRVVVAHLEEARISRRHARLEPLPGGRVRLINCSGSLPIRLEDGTDLPPRAVRELPLPAVFTLGGRTVRLQAAEADEAGLFSLAHTTRAPTGALPPLRGLPAARPAPTEMVAILQWLQTVMEVLQCASSSGDFFAPAARAAVELVGLDSGRVLLLEQGTWRQAALHTAAGTAPQQAGPPSQLVLGKVRDEKRTFWQLPEQPAADAASLLGLEAVVAAPILSPRGDVLGALYGDRPRGDPEASVPPIGEAEALLVELLATGVAAGLARLEQEEAALAARVQFEQFFTPELARQLEAQPDLLKGQVREVTLLFCDVRGFSRVSERVGPAGTVAWISAIMEALSQCVLAEQGVLVDYIGDELMAMWGAPQDQPDHARRAARAALAMLGVLPELNARLQPKVGEAVSVGIGLNSGATHVGNTGSTRKFKYGPLGNPVNLASRVQGATKFLKAPLLLTGETWAQLGPGFVGRRLGRVQVVNIAGAVDLYELVPGEPAGAPRLRAYEAALAAYEGGEFRQAAHILSNLQREHPEDGPSLVLLARAVQALVENGGFDPVWKLPGK
jgi:adenylate cyclase